MTTDDATDRFTNAQVGDAIGLSHAQISRIRSGVRLPSIAAMTRIAGVLKWTEQDQINARSQGTYAIEFETRVIAHYTNPGPTD